MIPGGNVAALAGVAGINLALPDILSRLAALQAFSPQPVSFVAQLALANATLQGINLSIALGLPLPDINAQIAAVLALIAALLAAVSAINANLNTITLFLSFLNEPGVHMYYFNGITANLGTEISAATSGGFPGGAGTDATQALLIGTSIPGTWAAIANIMKVTP
jgi:hypothetical protein